MNRSLLAALALLTLVASPALAGEDEIADFALEIEVSNDLIIHFSQIDVMVSNDPVPQIAGVTDQFGEMTLGEVLLNQPIPRAELDALAAASDKALSFQCARGGLYEVEGTRLVGGEGCDIVGAQSEDDL